MLKNDALVASISADTARRTNRIGLDEEHRSIHNTALEQALEQCLSSVPEILRHGRSFTEQDWSSTAAALQQYWSRFAEILLKQHCNSIGAVLEEFSGGTEQYCSRGAVPQQSWRNIGARLEYACSVGQLAPEYCSNILLDFSICIPYSGFPRILF